MRDSLRRDDRGLATGVIAFVAVIVVSALLYTLFEPAAQGVFNMSSSQADSTQAQNAIDRREQIFSLMLYFCLFLGSVMFIARAVVESRRAG